MGNCKSASLSGTSVSLWRRVMEDKGGHRKSVDVENPSALALALALDPALATSQFKDSLVSQIKVVIAGSNLDEVTSKQVGQGERMR